MDEGINRIFKKHISDLKGNIARANSIEVRNSYTITIHELTSVFAEINGISYVAAMDQLAEQDGG